MTPGEVLDVGRRGALPHRCAATGRDRPRPALRVARLSTDRHAGATSTMSSRCGTGGRTVMTNLVLLCRAPGVTLRLARAGLDGHRHDRRDGRGSHRGPPAERRRELGAGGEPAKAACVRV